MIRRQLKIEDQGCGEVKVSSHIVQKNDALAALAAWKRSLPPEERKKMKHVKVVGFYPVYAPTGMFKANESTIMLDDDQLDHLIREAPEFRAEHDPLASKPRLVVNG